MTEKVYYCGVPPPKPEAQRPVPQWMLFKDPSREEELQAFLNVCAENRSKKRKHAWDQKELLAFMAFHKKRFEMQKLPKEQHDD
jgi:hypothetical protein